MIFNNIFQYNIATNLKLYVFKLEIKSKKSLDYLDSNLKQEAFHLKSTFSLIIYRFLFLRFCSDRVRF